MNTTTITITALALAATAATASPITVTIENTSADGGFFFTPVWVGFHDGSFDSYDTSADADLFDGITQIAEGGNTAPISDRFAANNPGATQATLASVAFDGDAPVYSPGESASFDIDVADSATNRYFSFASMIVPSNDLFVGNDNPFAYNIFNKDGSFAGPVTIEFYGRDVRDNGSEFNNASGGAAFSALGGDSASEDGVIRAFFSDSGDIDYLASFVGTGTANGDSIDQIFTESTLLGRITIVPAPSSIALAIVGAPLLTRRRRN